MDCDTMDIFTSVPAGDLVRDLAGRLFIVEQIKCGGYGDPYRDGGRREVTYSEALDFIAKQSNWKHPWKVLALRGIKAPQTWAPVKRIKSRKRQSRRDRPVCLPKELPPFDQGGELPACLCIFDVFSNGVVAKVPLSDDEWIALIQSAAKQGILPEQFIAAVIRKTLPSIIGDSVKPDTLNNPAAQSNAQRRAA